jgi:hypothetical protein
MKLPILRPAVEAIVFAFENIISIARIAWLPVLLVILLYCMSFFAFLGIGVGDVIGGGEGIDATMERAFGGPGLFGFYIAQFTVLPVVAMLLLACVYVAIIRAAVERDHAFPSGIAFFQLGVREIRFVLTQILYGLFIGVSAFIMIVILAATAWLTSAAIEAVDSAAQFLIIAPVVVLVVFVFMIWLWLVLRFLPVTAIAAVENRIAFGDAWSMTRGNFWRIIGAGLLFIFLYQAVVTVFAIVAVIPGLLVAGIFFSAGAALGEVIAVIGLVFLVIIGAIFLAALIAFGAGAEISFPARIYAHLSGRAERT